MIVKEKKLTLQHELVWSLVGGVESAALEHSPKSEP